MSRIVATRDGVEVTLDAPEVAILSRLPSLLGSVGAHADDPAVERLHPPAYRDDPEGARELQRLTQDDLSAARSADIGLFTTQLEAAGAGTELTEADAEAWVRVLGAARLTLAARRHLFDMEDLSSASNADPDVALVNLLGFYQQSLSEALLTRMTQS